MSAPAALLPTPVVRSMRAIGTTASVVVEDAALADAALGLLATDLADLDGACSRFRPDSELRAVERLGQGRPMPVSPLLFAALDAASVVAARTAGIVDPTVGSALVELGYDRDFVDLAARADSTGPDDAPAGPGAAPAAPPTPAPGWWQVVLDPATRTVAVPAGVHVDLGSTGKAFAADRSAGRIAAVLDCGVLVNLGGDVAVAGPAPTGGWGVGIAYHSATPPDESDQVVALHSGGLASSGTTARTWSRGGRRVHHIVDPWTGEVAPSTWALVSVLAPTCLEANGWSTAAIVWGEDAPGNLAAHGVAARLVASDGSVRFVGGWPVPGAVTVGTDAAGKEVR